MEQHRGRDKDRDRKSYKDRYYDRKRDRQRDYDGNDDCDRRHKRRSQERDDDHQRHRHRERSHNREDRYERSTDHDRRKKRKSGFTQNPVVDPPPPDHGHRIYVGGIPPTARAESIELLFINAMAKIGGDTKSTDGSDKVVVEVEINHEEKFALVKMRSEEEASNAMVLDGINFEGVPLRVLRPSDYDPALASRLDSGEPIPNLNVAAVAPLGLHGAKAGYNDLIIVAGLPSHLNEETIWKFLVKHGGEIQELSLEKDTDTGDLNVKALYYEPSVVDDACRSINGFKYGGKILTAKRVNPSFEP